MLTLPESCPRGCGDCSPLSQILSDNGVSFVCVGENDGSRRAVMQDIYTVCVKSAAVDSREHVDARDLTDQAAVIAGALSVIANRAVRQR
jgi:hypothetical protein